MITVCQTLINRISRQKTEQKLDNLDILHKLLLTVPETLITADAEAARPQGPLPSDI